MKTIIYTLITISLIASILVFGWFKDGYILGVAEGTLPFYDLTRFYDQVKLAWTDTNPGMGFSNGMITAYAPTFYVLSFFERIGIPAFIIEAVFLWFFLFASALGIILFIRELFPKISSKYLLLAALFYWFNLLSLVNIWNRFLYGFIALWALLPLVSAIYIKGLRKQNFLYVFIIGIICAVFSLGLSNPVFNVVLWFVLSFITLFYFFTTKIKTNKLFYPLFFALNLVYFCLVNLWWIGQVIRHFLLGKYSEELSSFFQDSVSLSTLTSSSQNLGDLTNLYRLLHKSFFTTPFAEWAKLFLGVGPVIIEFLLTAIVLLFVVRYRKNIQVIFLALLFTTGLYLAKGSNPPFGGLFEFLFINITFLQIFRNPFEKFGFIIPLAFTPLFAAGLEDLSLRFKSKIRLAIYILLLFIVVGLFGYPFWSGLVFTGMFPPTNDYSVGYKVEVPDYYKQADQWLDSQGQNYRFIGFPYNGQGVTYKWEKGYQGIEPSMWLFSTPNIMFSTTSLYFDKIANDLEELLVKHDKSFYKVMNVLNSKFLMIRSDVDFHERNMKDPKKVEEIANKMKQEGIFKGPETFNKLRFWENVLWKDRTIYAATNLIRSSPTVKLVDFTLPEASLSSAAFQKSVPALEKMVSLEIIRPNKQEEGSDPFIYQFDLQERGIYELLANSPIKQIDNNVFTSKPTLREDGRYPYSSLDLEKGIHEIEFMIQDSDNLAVQGRNNEYTISDFDSFSKYQVIFEYFAKENTKINISQDNDQIKEGQIVPSYVRDLSKSTGNSFYSFKDIYEPRSTSSSVRIYFSGIPKDSLVIKNMNVQKRVNPDVLLIKKSTNISDQAPLVAYIKNSPTHYKINIKNPEGPFVLIFSSVFSPGWELAYVDGSKINNHFLVNSYANGWLIDMEGDYTLDLSFSLQEGLANDSRISIIFFIGGSLILLGGLVSKKLI